MQVPQSPREFFFPSTKTKSERHQSVGVFVVVSFSFIYILFLSSLFLCLSFRAPLFVIIERETTTTRKREPTTVVVGQLSRASRERGITRTKNGATAFMYWKN